MRMINITFAPARSQQSYRHEAFLWHDASDFTAGIVPFIRDGLEAGEPVMVAVDALHTKWLRDALDGHADVEFVDMEELGRNPAQIIPAWQAVPEPRVGAVWSRTRCRGADLAWTAPSGAC
jgi:hypothetical protein